MNTITQKVKQGLTYFKDHVQWSMGQGFAYCVSTLQVWKA